MLQVFTVWEFDVCYFWGYAFLMEITWALRSGRQVLLLKCVTLGNSFYLWASVFLIFGMGTISLNCHENWDSVCDTCAICAPPLSFLTQKMHLRMFGKGQPWSRAFQNNAIDGKLFCVDFHLNEITFSRPYLKEW